MLIYRVQICGDGFILRHPDHCVPLIQCKTQQEVIDKLPDFFKQRKNEHCRVAINDANGQYERTMEFPLAIKEATLT